MDNKYSLTVDIPKGVLALTSPSGWVVLGVAGLVCVTVVAVTAITKRVH